jgi:hypothetical protein
MNFLALLPALKAATRRVKCSEWCAPKRVLSIIRFGAPHLLHFTLESLLLVKKRAKMAFWEIFPGFCFFLKPPNSELNQSHTPRHCFFQPHQFIFTGSHYNASTTAFLPPTRSILRLKSLFLGEKEPNLPSWTHFS